MTDPVCSNPFDSYQEPITIDENLIMIKSNNAYICLTRDEVKHMLTYNVPRDGRYTRNLPVVEQYTNISLFNKQQDPQYWYYRIPTTGQYVNHTFRDLIEQKRNSMELKEKEITTLFRSYGVSGMHDQRHMTYSVRAVKRCDFYTLPDCKESDFFNERIEIINEDDPDREETEEERETRERRERDAILHQSERQRLQRLQQAHINLEEEKERARQLENYDRLLAEDDERIEREIREQLLTEAENLIREETGNFDIEIDREIIERRATQIREQRRGEQEERLREQEQERRREEEERKENELRILREQREEAERIERTIRLEEQKYPYDPNNMIEIANLRFKIWANMIKVDNTIEINPYNVPDFVHLFLNAATVFDIGNEIINKVKLLNLPSLITIQNIQNCIELTVADCNQLVLEGWPRVSLSIYRCDNIWNLPRNMPTTLQDLYCVLIPIEEIPECNGESQLQKLTMIGLNMRRLNYYPNLSDLVIDHMPNFDFDTAFRHNLRNLTLQRLDIQNIPNSIPNSITVLKLLNNLQLRIINKFPSSCRELEIYNCPNLEQISSILPNTLRRIEIEHCPLLTTITVLPNELEEFVAINCPQLREPNRPRDVTYFSCDGCIQSERQIFERRYGNILHGDNVHGEYYDDED